ncbi:MAG: precorrin-3B C(17)-methyltransferase [Blastococcus sp.]
MIGLVAVTAAGRAAADRLAAAWPDARRFDGPAAAAVPRAWQECEGLVCFLAAGATVRLIAPLLDSKDADPAVVAVDEAGRWAVPLLGGHGQRRGQGHELRHGGGHAARPGANELAQRVADVLGAEPVVTTATDARNVPGLDTLGWPLEGAVATVSRAILDGEPVRLDADATWPLPALPPNVADAGDVRLLITDGLVDLDGRTAVLRPRSLVVGVGASRGAPADEIDALVDAALTEAALSPLSVRHIATVDAKAAEPGIVAMAARRGWQVVTYEAGQLAEVAVPNPSEAARQAVGTPSVAEASALAEGGVLLVGKQKSAHATVAVARLRPRGRQALVGLGPGARDLLTPRAVGELRRASVVVGLDQYVAQVADLLRPGTRVLSSGLGAEEERARAATEEARTGHAVALIGSGDAGIYGMAAPALEFAGDDIDVVGVPGVTASLAAAALLGAPLGHDHAAISLSDLHTPWEAIERRVRAAAEGEFVVTFYNPRSRGREWQLTKALGILAGHRPPGTPVAVVREASRTDELIRLGTLAEFDPTGVDMRSVVVVGNSNTCLVAGRMVTPRGYRWLG